MDVKKKKRNEIENKTENMKYNGTFYTAYRMKKDGLL
jgi:hypothetical protein